MIVSDMMLLGEVSMETGSAVQTGATLVTVLMALIAAVFSFLTNRDRLRFDFEKNALRLTNEQLLGDVAELRAETLECHKERQEVMGKLESERSERLKQYAAFDVEMRQLREQFNDRVKHA